MNKPHEEAQRLIDAITDQAARDEANYQRGYEEAAKLFFQHGVEVGRAQAETSMANAWTALATHIRAMANTPTHNELQQRRLEPHGDAHHEALTRRGGHEYTGGPVTWDTQPADTTTPQPADPRATPSGAAA